MEEYIRKNVQLTINDEINTMKPVLSLLKEFLILLVLPTSTAHRCHGLDQRTQVSEHGAAARELIALVGLRRCQVSSQAAPGPVDAFDRVDGCRWRLQSTMQQAGANPNGAGIGSTTRSVSTR